MWSSTTVQRSSVCSLVLNRFTLENVKCFALVKISHSDFCVWFYFLSGRKSSIISKNQQNILIVLSPNPLPFPSSHSKLQQKERILKNKERWGHTCTYFKESSLWNKKTNVKMYLTMHQKCKLTDNKDINNTIQI